MGNIQNRFLRLPNNYANDDDDERIDDLRIDIDQNNNQNDRLYDRNLQPVPAADFRDDDVLFFGAHVFPGGNDNEPFPFLQRVLNLTPPVKRTKTLKSPISLNKNSLKLIQTDQPGVYNLQFNFDSICDGKLKIYYCAREVISKDSSFKYETVSKHKNDILLEGSNSFPLDNLKDYAVHKFSKGSNMEFITNEDQQLNTNIYDEKILTLNAFTNSGSDGGYHDDSDSDSEETSIQSRSSTQQHQHHDTSNDIIPIVIILKPYLDKEMITDKTLNAHITYATLLKCNDGIYEAKVVQQKVIIGGLPYIIHDIFGMDEDQECVICMTEIRNTLVLPCRHMCLCHSCAETIKHQSVKCPICRGPVKALLKLDIKGSNDDKNQDVEIDISADD